MERPAPRVHLPGVPYALMLTEIDKACSLWRKIHLVPDSCWRDLTFQSTCVLHKAGERIDIRERLHEFGLMNAHTVFI